MRVSSAIVYDDLVDSSTICGSGNHEPFTIPSRTYETGTGKLDMVTFRVARVLDFSTVFEQLFDPSNDASTLFLRVQNFLQHQWNYIRSFDLYLLPINKNAQRQGRRSDLPNVTFALTTLMMRQNIDFIIVDPIYSGTDSHVRVVNFSRALRFLQNNNSCRILAPRDFTSHPSDQALQLVFYQRGHGKPDTRTETLICNATGLGRYNIVGVSLTPGKYSRDTGRPTIIYKQFKHSAATILHELSTVDPFVQASNKRMLRKIYFVLDEFSAYAAYSAIAMIGYGIESQVSVLCYYNGRYRVS